MATTSAPFSVVEAPAQRAPRFTLLTTADALNLVAEGQVTVPDVGADDPDTPSAVDRWLNGFGFRPWACGGGFIYDPCLGSGDSPIGPITASTAGAEYWSPYVAEVGVECTTLSGTDDADYQRARHLLNIRQHELAALELWAGYISQDSADGNPYLADGTATSLNSGSTVGALDGLASLEEALAGVTDDGCTFGGQGMIHASARLVTIWRALELVVDTGLGYLATTLGTPIATGVGATGEGHSAEPTTSLQYAYVTGLPTVRLGRVSVLNRDHRDVNRSVNLDTVWAQRAVSVAYDSCCVAVAKIDLTNRC